MATFLEKQTCHGNSSHENHNGNHFKPIGVETIEENKSFEKFLKNIENFSEVKPMGHLVRHDWKKTIFVAFLC